jgi:hypothetical protein
MVRKERLLRTRDVAHILDCSPAEVVKLARMKRLRARKRGRFWIYRYVDVMIYRELSLGERYAVGNLEAPT